MNLEEIEERKEMLDQATQKVEEAIYLIESALEGTQAIHHAKAYVIGHLNTWIGNGNPYDKSIEAYKEDLDEALFYGEEE